MKAHWEMLKQHNKNTLGFHLMYGKMLNEAFNQHELEKDECRTDSIIPTLSLSHSSHGKSGFSSPQ